MKKFFVASLLLSLASISQATTIVATCTPNPAPFLGQSGSGTESCSFAGIPGGATINSIIANYTIDFQFASANPGTRAVDFTFNAPGTTADFSGTVTQGTRPLSSGNIAIGSGEWSLFTGASFSVADSYTGASTAITGATFEKVFTLDYTAAGSSVPEPATYTMIGLGLSALALFRRK